MIIKNNLKVNENNQIVILVVKPKTKFAKPKNTCKRKNQKVF